MFYLPKYLKRVLILWLLLWAGFDYFFQPSYPSVWQISLGIFGLFLILMAFSYNFRKNYNLFKFIKLRTFVNIHIFAGLMGLILIGYHSQMRFDRPIAFWMWGSLLSLVISGLFGQYLFLRLPREKNGLEEDLTDAFEEKEAAYFNILAIFADNDKVLDALKELDHLIYVIQKTPIRFIIMLKTDVWVRRSRKNIQQQLHTAIEDKKLYLQTNELFQKYITIHMKLHYLEMTKKIISYWVVVHKGFVLFVFFLIGIHIYINYKTYFLRDLPFF